MPLLWCNSCCCCGEAPTAAQGIYLCVAIYDVQFVRCMHAEGLERLQSFLSIMPHGMVEARHGLFWSFCMHAAARSDLRKHIAGTAA